uniref:Ig-like domain-containing protein n=1 Tax=Klebsiella pneumoniae TaxID=573 RepID=A0A8B0SSJ2_KLEPN|nr:hypothetical protein [Klebsiella pneumoniae]
MVVTGPRWELGQGQESAINLAIKNINDLSGFDKAIVQIIKTRWINTIQLYNGLRRWVKSCYSPYN